MRRFVSPCLFVLLALALVLAAGTPGHAGEKGAPWVRTVVDEGNLGLDIAVREFVTEDETAPRIWMVGVVHVADAAYYEAVQAVLDPHPLVLYEQVMPEGAGQLRAEPAEAAVGDTRLRLHLLASLLEGLADRVTEVPADLAALQREAKAISPHLGHFVRRAQLDAWGRAIDLLPLEGAGWRLRSLGADGAPGGEGPDADLEIGSGDDVPALGSERGGFDLQRKLAQVLHLSHQGEGIDYARDNWRPSDMALDEVRRAAAARGGDLDQFMDLLSGRGLRGAIVRVAIGLLRFVDALSGGTASAALKARLMLALAEDDPEHESTDPVEAATMKAIIEDRNAVVMKDIEAVLAADDRPASFAVFYGAGHMADFERRLQARGYAAGREIWLRAMEVDLGRAQIDPADLDEIREEMREAVRNR